MRRTSTDSSEYDMARKETKDDVVFSTEDIETVAADDLQRADCLPRRSCIYNPQVAGSRIPSRSDLKRNGDSSCQKITSMRGVFANCEIYILI
jgi:hypothetical protein